MSISALPAALLSALVMSLLSLAGYAALTWKHRRTALVQKAVVAFAAGALLGNAFFHLIPESLEMLPSALSWVLGGILAFFAMDSLFWIYHCHAGHSLHDETHGHGSCPTKPVGYLNLIGDFLHNFTDGVAVMSAFLVSPAIGLSTAIAIALHEIPQELSDFGILLSAGFSKKRALLWNLGVSFSMFIGVVGTYVLASYVTGLTTYTIPLAAGGMIYMACTNLFSEIKEEPVLKTRLWQGLALIIGLGLLWLTAGLE